MLIAESLDFLKVITKYEQISKNSISAEPRSILYSFHASSGFEF